MGHIELSRSADFVLVCPATADLLAKMAAGIADDLATTLLLATDKKVVVAPAMNVRMWQHPATSRNVAQLKVDGVDGHRSRRRRDGVRRVRPGPPARSRKPSSTSSRRTASSARSDPRRQAHPRHRRPDPRADRPRARDRQSVVRPSGLRDRSGRRRAAGARVTLVAGPVSLKTPPKASIASTWRPPSRWPNAVMAALPADCAIMVAAVADWRVEMSTAKLKKGDGPPKLKFVADPRHPRRRFRRTSCDRVW